MDRAFWSAPHRWPRDTAGYVFLARAYDQIGRARFPDDWTGEEAVTLPPRRERRAPVWSLDPEVDHILTVIAGSPPAGTTDTPAVIITPAEELSETERADRTSAIVRSGTIVQFVLEKAAAGVLKLAYLPTDNSAPLRLCPEAWGLTAFRIALQRLWRCQIDPGNPFSPGVGGAAWLFVARESLQTVLEQLAPKRGESGAKSRAGRKKRGTFDRLDAPLLQQMQLRIDEGASVHAAALAVAAQAVAEAKKAKRSLPKHLRASEESIARRLADAHKAKAKS